MRGDRGDAGTGPSECIRGRPRRRRYDSFLRAGAVGCSLPCRLPLPGALEVPLAEVDPVPGRRWNLGTSPFRRVVDTARNGPLTVGYGDSDGRGFRASADDLAR